MTEEWKPFVTPKAESGRGSATPTNAIRVSSALSSGDNSKRALTFKIGSDLAKKLRWLEGDKVVPVQKDDMIGFMRSNTGWKLCVNMKKKSHNTSGLVCKITVPPEVLALYVNGEPRIVSDPLIDGQTVIIGEPLKHEKSKR